MLAVRLRKPVPMILSIVVATLQADDLRIEAKGRWGRCRYN
jgi:hypothetical protein